MQRHATNIARDAEHTSDHTVSRAVNTFRWITVLNSYPELWIASAYNFITYNLYEKCLDSIYMQSSSYLLQKLEELNKFPDFNNYLIFVLTKLVSEGKYIVRVTDGNIQN